MGSLPFYALSFDNDLLYRVSCAESEIYMQHVTLHIQLIQFANCMAGLTLEWAVMWGWPQPLLKELEMVTSWLWYLWKVFVGMMGIKHIYTMALWAALVPV